MRRGESRWGGRGGRCCWRPVRAGPELRVGEPRSGARRWSRPRGHRPLPPLRCPRASGAGGEALPGSRARLPSERTGSGRAGRTGPDSRDRRRGPCDGHFGTGQGSLTPRGFKHKYLHKFSPKCSLDPAWSTSELRPAVCLGCCGIKTC